MNIVLIIKHKLMDIRYQIYLNKSYILQTMKDNLISLMTYQIELF